MSAIMESQGTQKTKMHIHTGANSRKLWKICSFTFFTVVPALSHRISPCRTTVSSVFLKNNCPSLGIAGGHQCQLLCERQVKFQCFWAFHYVTELVILLNKFLHKAESSVMMGCNMKLTACCPMFLCGREDACKH